MLCRLTRFKYGPAVQTQPRCAASIVAMSIFFIRIIASNARLAAAGSGPVIAFRSEEHTSELQSPA